MLLPINETVIAGEGAQPLSLLKIFNSTLPVPVGRSRLLVNQFKKFSPRPE